MSSHSPLRGRRSLWLLTAAIAVIALAGLATLAIAKTTKKPKPLVKTARNATQKATILVDPNGITLYELKPETVKRLLCKSSLCIQFWPPAKVGKKTKLAKGNGVKGTLGRLQRKGFDQLTLDGRPLYRYLLDKGKKGSTNGQGIMVFGGTWHVVKESSSTKSTHTTTTTTTTSSSPYPYPYP